MNTEHTNQPRQAEPVNQQLLALVKSFGHKTGCAKNAFGEQCTCGVDEAIAAAEQAEPMAPAVKESLTADRQEAFRVGNLVTYNQDEYPGLGTWYVQLWEGESIAARVYGNDREELSRRVTALNVVPPPAPQKAEPVARDVLTAALNEMRDACSFAVSGDIGVKSADKVMAGVDIGPIVDRHAAQPPAVAVAVPDGWDAESVRLAFSTLRYIIGLKPDGIKAPFDHVQDIIEKVASWSDMGPCHPVRKQYEAAAAHRAMLAAAPQGASCLPAEMTPAMMRAVQMRSELGAYAAANLAGAYDLFAEFWRVAVEEVKKGGVFGIAG